MGLLVNHFNPDDAARADVPLASCRSAGTAPLYDCDFNQMLELPLGAGPRTICELDDLGELAGAPIATAPHCFGCTAGSGSSCGGALA